MDIIFIHPNASKIIYQDLSKNLSAIEPPIWAAMLAQHVRMKGYETTIWDCEALNFSDDFACKNINHYKPKIACFVVYGQQPSASTQNMTGATSLSKRLRELHPEIKILFVGGHVAALPKETMMKHPEIDFVCQNEGVYTISELLQVKNLNDVGQINKVHGLGWRLGKDICLNAPMPIVPKEKLMIDLPGMAWDLLPMHKYRTALWHSYPNNCERENFASIYTSLGCPYKCHFCMINIINKQDNEYSSGSNVFRYWDPEFTINELQKLSDMGIKNLKIADEMFVLNKNHFMRLCELIIERGFNFNIWCYARIDTIKDEYLDTLKKSGVNYLGLGIESGVSRVRKDVIKGKFEEVDIRSIVKKIHDHGINVAANYIYGLPEDNYDSMTETFNLAVEMQTEMVNFYCAMAYPGSPLYGSAKEKGWKLPETYSGYSQHSYDCQPLPSNHLSAKEILAFRDNAWMQYHTDPQYLNMILNKFGQRAAMETYESTKIILKRKLLEN